ncbi:hypothetical protein [uncultured Psychroserpens sp.]|uniref:hypothetical protein n=1 Tax=uncultured Psychroserpens sp. TaxID=255436 RepID=UPI002618CDBC|nr:hypothetical protein [uncultured Psychroserpens sp.]
MNKRTLWYVALLLYLIGLTFNYFYVSNQIAKQERFIISLEDDFNSNEKKLDSLKRLKQDFKRIDSLLNLFEKNDTKTSEIIKLKLEFDSINKKKEGLNIINRKNDLVKTKDSLLLKKQEIQFDSTKVEKTKPTVATQNIDSSIRNAPKTNIKKETVVTKETVNKNPAKEYLFTKIVGVYSSLKRSKPIRTNDKYLWIVLESTNANYTNALRSMLKGITINGTYVHIADIDEAVVGRKNNTYIINYYIKVKLPKVKILHSRNQLVINADRAYYELFSAR